MAGSTPGDMDICSDLLAHAKLGKICAGGIISRRSAHMCVSPDHTRHAGSVRLEGRRSAVGRIHTGMAFLPGSSGLIKFGISRIFK